MVTVLGTVTLALLLATVIPTPPVGTAATKLMVQVDAPGALTVDGPQLNTPSWAAPTPRLTLVDWLWPFSVAVTVAFRLLLTVPALAGKVALLWPRAMVTLAGTISTVVLLLRETVRAPGAALFNNTVHVIEALLPKADGAQDTEASWAGPRRFRLKVTLAPLALAVKTA